MVIYNESIATFIQQCKEQRIRSIVLEAMKTHGYISVGTSEQESWEKSLPKVAEVLEQSSIEKDVPCAIEYRTRMGNGRIDFLLYGADESDRQNVVVLELKQWSSVAVSTKPNHVFACVGGGVNEDHAHPSCQALNYIGMLKNFVEYIDKNDVRLSACSYLFNMPQANQIVLLDENKYPFIKTSPAFLKEDVSKLIRFIETFVSHKYAKTDILYQIEHSEIRPSAHLSSVLAQAIKGNPVFSFDDGQENAISTIVQAATDHLFFNEKTVILIRGGAGTGKTVVAINALGQLISPKRGKPKNAIYVATNAAIRTEFSDELVQHDYKKGFLKELFKFPTALVGKPTDSIDCGIFDEAHRLFAFRGGTGVKKDINVLSECIRACRISVFFLDGDQAVTTADAGEEETIRALAFKNRARVYEGPQLALTSQYRCLGGDDYIQFIKHFLGYQTEPREKYSLRGYEFGVVDSPKVLMDIIRKKDEEWQEIYAREDGKLISDHSRSGKCRLVASNTHYWYSKGEGRDGEHFDFDYEDGFRAKWNLRYKPFGPNYSWLDDPDSISEIGCIHTCQGLDLNYCGVIIGKDLIYRNGTLCFCQEEDATSDKISGIRRAPKEVAERLIRNTYHVLLTRGMKGTFVYCEDHELGEYLKDLIRDQIVFE